MAYLTLDDIEAEMTQERLSVRKICEILRLQEAGISNMAVAQACRRSKKHGRAVVLVD
jgi:hypothetical protein